MSAMPPLARAEKLLASIFAKTFKPREDINVPDWCAREVILSPRFTSHPGPFDPWYTAYTIGIQLEFTNPYTRRITFPKFAQSGGTTAISNCMMWAIKNDPGPSLYVTSTADNAQAFAERELIPRFQSCRALESEMPDNPDDFKKTEMHFKSLTLRLVGANSAAQLASAGVRYLYKDELDKWKEDNGAEASSSDLADVRTIEYKHTCKIVEVSTPTLETGPIWRSYLKGDQRKFHVPCPHCGHRQELVFGQVRWPEEHKDLLGNWDLDAVERDAWYECAAKECAKAIPQHKRGWMIREGAKAPGWGWVASNPRAPREHVSFHISALYSPSISWGALAKIFLQKKDTAGGLHDFYNSYLGLPWTPKASTTTITEIDKLIAASPEYYLGTVEKPTVIPTLPLFLLMSVDVQQSELYWVIRAWCLGATSYLVDYGSAISFDDISRMARRVFPAKDSEETFSVARGIIDSGYAAKRESGVYQFCLESSGLFWPSKGRTISQGLMQPVKTGPILFKGQTVPLIQYNDPMFKSELYVQKVQERAGAGFYAPRNVGRDWKLQMTGERLAEKRNERGYMEMVWDETGPNHLGDCEKKQLVMAHMIADLLLPPPEEPEAQAAGS